MAPRRQRARRRRTRRLSRGNEGRGDGDVLAPRCDEGGGAPHRDARLRRPHARLGPRARRLVRPRRPRHRARDRPAAGLPQRAVLNLPAEPLIYLPSGLTGGGQHAELLEVGLEPRRVEVERLHLVAVLRHDLRVETSPVCPPAGPAACTSGPSSARSCSTPTPGSQAPASAGDRAW